jgi:hypothetical protein
MEDVQAKLDSVDITSCADNSTARRIAARLRSTSGTGWELRSAQDINDAGQIVGEGMHDGRSTAFVLTPSP